MKNGDVMAGQMRLQKFLSDAGVSSRRRAEELILEGRVLLNGEVVETLPAFVDPAHDHVIVDGSPVRPQRLEYFLLHKPKGVVCTNNDPAGRTRAVDLLPDLSVRLFPVGRLDADSTGLLLLTNDGELAQKVTHPSYGIRRTYHVEVRGCVPRELPELMRTGVYLSEGKAQASEVEIVHTSRERSALSITLRQGRNRQVRRMLARLGYPVRRLKRTEIGSLSLRKLPVGAARRLTVKELATLRAELEQASQAARRRPTRRDRPSGSRKTTNTPSGGRKRRREAEPKQQSSSRGRKKAPQREPDTTPSRRRLIT